MKTKTKTRTLFRFRPAVILHHISQRRNTTYDKFAHSDLKSPACTCRRARHLCRYLLRPITTLAGYTSATPIAPPHPHPCRHPLRTRTSVTAACASARLSPPVGYSHQQKELAEVMLKTTTQRRNSVYIRLRPRTFIATVYAPVLARMVNRKTHDSQRLRRIISGHISRQAGRRVPGAANVAELLHTILRAAIDVAFVGRKIEPEPSGRESDRLLRREALCLDRLVEHFTL
jgi:hypothetical protein